MRVQEVYESIEGELPNIGRPCLIVRFAGCNVQCPYCDAPNNEGKEILILELVELINASTLPEVLITGGEPLMQRDLPILLAALSKLSKPVVLETNGTILLPMTCIPYVDNIVMDVKLFKETFETESANLGRLGSNDAIKFVYSSEAELIKAIGFVLDKCVDAVYMIVFSPVNLDQVYHEKILDLQRHNPKLDIRLQTQIHKHLNLG